MTAATMMEITGDALTIEQVEAVATEGITVALGDTARARVAAARQLVDDTAEANMSTYGLNTGVGRFVDKHIEPGQVGELQRRVLRSHAAGVGRPYPDSVVRAALLLRANTLALGYSGVRPELVDQLLAVLNAGVIPHVPARGSVGASGDLAPLAHLCLPLVGEGKAWIDGALVSGEEALRHAGLSPVELVSKEGLSLINGTQFMCAMGVLYSQRALRLMQLADVVCALSTEALHGSLDSFLPQVHALRAHRGQGLSAHNTRRAMDSSSILESHRYCDRVQDAYAIRCAPQVHGASRDALEFARTTIATEIVSVTDNPLVFVDEELLRSNGNFHGQPLAIALDVMCIALAEIASIAERRVERLVNPALSGLPAFLVSDGGLNSGFMIAQYTAAALVSENKVLCHPASVDSIPTSAGQEDHVSMGNHAGLKLAQVLENAERVVAIELLCAAQAVEFHRPRTPGHGAGVLHELVREHIPFLSVDRELGSDIEQLAAVITRREFLGELQERMGWELQ